jgi:hypothetical protein
VHKDKIFLVCQHTQLPVQVAQLVSHSSLEHGVLGNCGSVGFSSLKTHSKLGPLVFREQVVVLMVDTRLKISHGVDFAEEAIRLIDFVHFDCEFKHCFRLRPLHDDLIIAFVSDEQIGKNFSKLAVQVVSLEVSEFILNRAHCKERFHLVARFVKQTSAGLVRVFVRETRLSEG